MNSIEEAALEVLTEAASPMRAWNGKLKRIDGILEWMYKIMTKTDQKRKDSMFNKYYRYYNDGDFPRGVPGARSYHSKEEIQAALEKQLDEFIKEMLSKYMPKVNRKEFRLDSFISHLKTVKSVSERFDTHGLLNYWLTKVRIQDEGGVLGDLTSKLKKLHDEINILSNKVNSSGKTKILPHRMETFDEEGVNLPEIKAKYKEIQGICKEITGYLDGLIKTAERLKTEL